MKIIHDWRTSGTKGTVEVSQDCNGEGYICLEAINYGNSESKTVYGAMPPKDMRALARALVAVADTIDESREP